MKPATPRCSAAVGGKADRSAALRTALDRARHRFEQQWQRPVNSLVEVRQAPAVREAPLQAADYFLWALQRHYERGEPRFVRLVWPKVGVVQAIDETASAPCGVYYTKKKPLA